VKTILIVDDSEEIVELIELALSKRGYAVLCSGQIPDALRLWEENFGRIDLLITDVKLGESGSGLDLAECLLASKPSLKVLAISGFLNDDPPAALAGRIAFLHKPFRWEAFGAQVDQLLAPEAQLTFAF
jgi:two-component system cell cycle sensor histidine kinase/response regulator CckA